MAALYNFDAHPLLAAKTKIRRRNAIGTAS
jgi:hypothetical protein